MPGANLDPSPLRGRLGEGGRFGGTMKTWAALRQPHGGQHLDVGGMGKEVDGGEAAQFVHLEKGP